MRRPGNHSGDGITPAVGRSEAEFVFLAVEHPGIPDAEILNKLLDAGSGRRPSRRVHGAKVPLPT